MKWSFNASTAAAFVAVSAGAVVAKHESLHHPCSSVSLKCLKLDLSWMQRDQYYRRFAELPITMMFKHIMGPPGMGFRTVPNMMGSLINPARVGGRLSEPIPGSCLLWASSGTLLEA